MYSPDATDQRVTIVGIDGFSPQWLDRFLDRGDLPALRRIISGGLRIPLVSTIPATTPVAWAAIFTGCNPNRNGIEGFLLHRPGRRLDNRISGIYASRLKAEPIWETAAMWGKRSFVVKFPVSYPSTTANLRIDGAAGWGGLKCLHEAASAGVADSLDAAGDSGIESIAPMWSGTPEDGARPVWFARLRINTLWGGPPLILELAVVEDDADDGPRVVLAERPDWAAVVGAARAGGWTEPMIVTAPCRTGELPCNFRLKVLDCTTRPPRLRLFHTCVHERDGHSAPAPAWRHLLEGTGPIEEQTDPELFLAGRLDMDTQFERFRLNTDWLKRVSNAILTSERWDLFMVQIHIVDWAHHMLEGALDPRHPLYDPATAPALEERLLQAYRMADELVATIADAAGPEANLVVLGDHGQDLHHTTVRLNSWLASQGWLAFDGDGRIDWTRTFLYAAGNYLYANVEGREPGGIVASEMVEILLHEACRKLLALTDPRTGERPVLIAGPKAHFSWLGADGEGVGDVVLCLASGYQARNDHGAIFQQTVPLTEFTSGHDHFWPLDPRIHTALFACGPGFRRGYARREASHVTDIYPTLCALLGIEASPDCQGRVLTDLLRGDADAGFDAPTSPTPRAEVLP